MRDMSKTVLKRQRQADSHPTAFDLNRPSFIRKIFLKRIIKIPEQTHQTNPPISIISPKTPAAVTSLPAPGPCITMGELAYRLV